MYVQLKDGWRQKSKIKKMFFGLYYKVVLTREYPNG
jgi:hypothetical protein